MNQLVKYIGLTDFLPEKKVSKFDLENEISGLSKIDSLCCLSLIEMSLSGTNPNDIYDINLQKYISEFLVGADISLKIYDLIKLKKDSIIFHKQQIYYLMSLIIKRGSNKSNLNTSASDKSKLFYLLLSINDLISKEDNKKVKEINLKKLIRNKYEALENSIILIWEKRVFLSLIEFDLGRELLRTHHVFKNTKKGQEYLDLFKKVIGLDYDDFIKIIFLFYIRWLNLDKNNLVSSNSIILKKEEITTYFKQDENELLNIENLDKILNILSANLDESNNLRKKSIEDFSNEHINFNFISNKPLIKFDTNKYICISIPFLLKKSIIDIIETLRTTIYDTNSSEKLSKNYGFAYEEYVKNLITNSFDKNNSKNVFIIKQKNSSGKEISDSIIFCNGNLVFIEVKAINIKKSSITPKSIKDIEEALSNFITKKGISQISDKITKIENKSLSIDELKYHNINGYWAIVVSCLFNIPTALDFFEYYDSILKKNNLLQDNKIRGFIFLNLDEIVYLMDLVKKGEVLSEILNKYSISKNNYYSFWNFLIFNYGEDLASADEYRCEMDIILDKYRIDLLDAHV